MIIVDNYFENIDDIRKLALKVNYFPLHQKMDGGGTDQINWSTVLIRL